MKKAESQTQNFTLKDISSFNMIVPVFSLGILQAVFSYNELLQYFTFSKQRTNYKKEFSLCFFH